MTDRASPSVGHGDNLPEASTYLRALALELQMQEKVKTLREQHKQVRKAIEGSGVALEDLTTLYKLRDKSETEIEGWFRRKWGALSAYFGGLRERFGDDLFARTYGPHDEHRQAWVHRGRMTGVSGLPAEPPKGSNAEEIQWWLSGWHEGNDAHEAAKPVLADILADALEDAEDGGVVDGTPTSTVGARAKARREARAAAEMVRPDPEKDDEDDGAAERLAAAGMGDE